MARFFFLSIFSLLFFTFTLGHPVCIDFSASQNQQNSFCSEYSGDSCCTPSQDTDIQSVIQGLGVSDQTCLNFITKTSCAVCDPWGAHLFGSEDNDPRRFPLLCPDYCSQFYQACSTVQMNWPAGKNPFETSSGVIRDTWSTESAFCGEFKNTTSYCYSGAKYEIPPPSGNVVGKENICTEQFSDTKIIDLIDPHDNSAKLLAAYQNGTINVLDQNDGKVLSTFVQIDTRESGEAGLLALDVHPKYATNGKFYVFWSDFNERAPFCEDDDWCNGKTCNTNTKTCNDIAFTNKLEEWQKVGSATPTKLRTLITVPKYLSNHNGGDIAFGADGYLYLGVGDGGGGNDPDLNAQNVNRRCGKMLRIDVDSTNYVSGRNYAVPSDNPKFSTKFPEIFAIGLRNPFRMSFDAARPSYFFVADVGQDRVEEVNLMVRGGNFGWPLYEGVGKTSKPGTIDGRVSPIFEYTHNDVDASPSVIGGYVYRGSQDACQHTKYIFADYTGKMWNPPESPIGSGRYIFSAGNTLTAKCAGDASCRGAGRIRSFAEDDYRDLYILGETTLRVVDPSRCGIACSLAIPETSGFTRNTQSRRPINGTTTTPGTMMSSSSTNQLLAMITFIVLIATL